MSIKSNLLTAATLLTLTGAAIVVATGLFTLYRESGLRVRRTPVPSAR